MSTVEAIVTFPEEKCW